MNKEQKVKSTNNREQNEQIALDVTLDYEYSELKC
jgi:hypothetical protein